MCKKKKFFTNESIKNDQFIYLNENLLIDFDYQLVHNTVSFEGYTNAYNAKLQVIGRRENPSFLPNSNNNRSEERRVGKEC